MEFEALVHGARCTHANVYLCRLYRIHVFVFVPGLLTAYLARRPMAQDRIVHYGSCMFMSFVAWLVSKRCLQKNSYCTSLLT